MLKLYAALSLAAAARHHDDVDAGLGRALVGLVAPWIQSSVVLRRDGRLVEASPGSLGILFEDTKYSWWWIRTTRTALPAPCCGP